MKRIVVGYWHSKLNDLPYEHNQEFEYSLDMMNVIIMLVLSKGYSVMLRPSKEQLTIWIDNGRFGQR